MDLMPPSSSMWPVETEPDPPRYADESAEEIEDSVAPAENTEAGADRGPERFLDRQASWLQFNERVLELAEDPNVPLLERVRFTAIFSRNLDEFFMVRVAALRRRVAAGITTRSAAGATPRERLDHVSLTAHKLVER
ncbi:MAG: polyphosphate kinase, partial [Actinomycetota bacterium]|nr:polyphosphate kinase [Actinomycetota bacterium]